MTTIEILSELRSQYSCFDEQEELVYRALSDAIKALSAQPDLDSAYTEGYTAAESKYRKMWDEMQYAQQEIIRCKDCVHYYGKPGNPNIICFQMHEDDFCSYAERRTDETD